MTSLGPLAGTAIIEMDAIGPVPLAAMMLADMGADVIRIARSRVMTGGYEDVGGAVLHRGRSSVFLDLKKSVDRDAALSLISQADALIEGFRPGVMERLGLGPDNCLASNPRLVYVRMTGWGQTGPLSQRAGHDLNYIAITGALRAMGSRGTPPPVPLNMIGDYGGGAMFALVGLLAALLHARATGKGQAIDVSMTDGVTLLSAMFHAFRASGSWIDERSSNLLDGSAPFYRCYACADGEYVAVGALEPQFFALLLDGLGLSRDRFVQMDKAEWPAMEAAFAAAFITQPRDYWATRFANIDACVTPVLSFGEAAEYSHNAARGTLDCCDGVTQPAPAPRFLSTPSVMKAAYGESSIEEILKRWSAVKNR